ncbi:uncharacterized protein Z519_11954 [Cladophialophora bantiana CBS 173.52]|uniref:Protein artemis n=1 Tax=Cladophialophora bantiana (strain ATCC 10958 / CBS 173.52 / CDC B-1940 / NIH 8579) TaxID=1442370 RepID=A0A0D2H1Z7_CLAB1|nr:uncharacterized protein Z519_11954 [Cladophialophora bantiana CBS 173.52]KIW87318.1 hypothetical protein Z519_11954 [Cladophialophora bantiana CBS 173.52]
MSTFNGLVKEFPNIRIDYFRHHPGRPPPAAYFLSHVHSDHLLGLESVKMPFVYCSATTKRILLNMEKYPHRINFAKGILEARKQHYRHLKTVLRTLPMSTATELELGPKSTIRVTLLDANHCPGAVMFLIEGEDKAILYTGDIRAESWWVNSIVQNPVLLPYACGLRHLDCIYLDTTFATREEPYSNFPTKAEGLKELLEKVSQCSPETTFYFRGWTLGYENVWIALSNVLQSRVHVDEYQFRIFGKGLEDAGNNESAALTGFTVGNSQLPGCFTLDNTARIHSCEPGLKCHSEIKQMKNIKWITPIISRLKDGTEIRELGAGGGARDLYPMSELKLEDRASFQQLLDLFASSVDDNSLKSKVFQGLGHSGMTRDWSLALEGPDELKVDQNGHIRLEDFVPFLSNRYKETDPSGLQLMCSNRESRPQMDANDTIHFPYSRHSSYNELRHFVGLFRPRDICPCTVCPETWSEELSMQALFGDLCADQRFYFDQETRELVEKSKEEESLSSAAGGKRKRGDDDTQQTESQDTNHNDGVSVGEDGEALQPPKKATKLRDAAPDEEGSNQEQRELSPTSLPKVDAVFRQRDGSIDGDSLGVDDSDGESLSPSAFDGQPGDQLVLSDEDVEEQSSGVELDCQGVHKLGSRPLDAEDTLERRQERLWAYKAAKKCLVHNDSSDWEAMPLRSVGHIGHDSEEIEL